MFENVDEVDADADANTDDGRWTTVYPISSPRSLRLWWAKKWLEHQMERWGINKDKKCRIWNYRYTNKEELQQKNRFGTVSNKSTWGLNWFYLQETSSLILMQLHITSTCSVCIGSATSSVKHHNETHTIKNIVVKQSKGFNGDLKLEQTKTTNETTMSPTTDIDSQAPTIWNRLRRGPSISLRTNPP